MGSDIKRGLLFTIFAMVLFGGAYPLVLWGVGRVAFPGRAAGSFLQDGNGTIVGSSLIAQRFERPEYFHPRPSGVDYNAASTGGTNYGPSNPERLSAVREQLDAITALEGVSVARVPSEMVTASGGGLDPHIPPGGAEIQVNRVAHTRGVDAERVRRLVTRHTAGPSLGFYGRARVNVLELNLALDRELGSPAIPDSTR